MGACLGCCWYCSVVKSCLTLSDTMDCSPPGSLSMVFTRQEYWSGLLGKISWGSSLSKEPTQSAGQAYTTELPGKMGIQYHRQTLGGTPGLWLTASPGGSSITDGHQEELTSRSQLLFQIRDYVHKLREGTYQKTLENSESPARLCRESPPCVKSDHKVWKVDWFFRCWNPNNEK